MTRNESATKTLSDILKEATLQRDFERTEQAMKRVRLAIRKRLDDQELGNEESYE